MKKIIRSTLRIEERLDFKIKLLAKRNRVSVNRMKEYLLELGLQTYLDKYDGYLQVEDIKMKDGERNEN